MTALAAALADRYTIDRELGAGGMATVYLAHGITLDRDVARAPLRNAAHRQRRYFRGVAIRARVK